MKRIRVLKKKGNLTASESLRGLFERIADGDYSVEIKKWSGSKTWEQIKTVKGVLIPSISKYTGETRKEVERRLKEDYGITERFTDSKGNPCIEYRSFRYYSKDELRDFIEEVLYHCEYDLDFIIDLETRKKLQIDYDTGELIEV